MPKRVYELAKELDLSSREVIAALAGLGFIAKSHSSTVENDVVVGESANVDLMAGIPIETDEIEELMNR